MTLRNDLTLIVRRILEDYQLSKWGYHGVVHWARVLENGLRIAEGSGADREVVALFAIFHDSRRENEHRDQMHGFRGGQFAAELRGNLVHLEDDQFELLHEACRLHTFGYTTGDITMQTCWDSDRLDLGRVGITPHPDRLCTPQARELIEWAHKRAITYWQPAFVEEEWGLKRPSKPSDFSINPTVG